MSLVHICLYGCPHGAGKQLARPNLNIQAQNLSKVDSKDFLDSLFILHNLAQLKNHAAIHSLWHLLKASGFIRMGDTTFPLS